MTELATIQPDTGTLTLVGEQSWWTPRQIAALQQIGVAGAGEGDLMVFMHVCQRTGLDPFARQIYMIGRNGREKVGNQWVDVVKQTIQTGIDGFRLVARRASDRLGETLEYEDTQWCGADGEWVDVWTKATAPAAARVTVLRHGKRFPAVAVYREYVQTKSGGEANAMWSKMPANQLAKCAEALALRKAFPHDLSGIYADEEMGQADRTERHESPAPASAADRMRAALADDGPHYEAPQAPESGEESIQAEPPASSDSGSPLLNTSSALAKRMHATFNEAGITERDDRLRYVSDVLGREVASSSEMTDADASQVIDALATDLEQPFGKDGA